MANFTKAWADTRPDLTAPQAQTLYEAEIEHIREDILRGFKDALGTTEGQALYTHLQGSCEMVSLLSLSYNAKKLVGPNLIKAMWNGNRAEAWFEIRYNSNLNDIHANRRYREADLFGLYDSGPMAAEQAKEIMRMYTIHELQETNPARRMSASFLCHLGARAFGIYF